jgi:ABC-type phosphate transport system substrate-binding protein
MLRNVLKNPTSSAFKLILGVVLAATSTIGSLPIGDRARAQSSQSATPDSELEQPKAVPGESKLRIDGSSSMVVVNKTLKQRYEKQFPGTNVELKAEGTERALQEVREGDIEVAAIGRPLKAEEKANDLQETPINREKIAIVVGVDNPYRGNMTYQEFAKIFRGEITDWSELGGPPGPIRLVDRPETSDTRQAFNGYSIFQEREFATGTTAEPIVGDSTDEMIGKLGKDGIGYAIASQVMERDDVRVVPMHKTLPDDPRYPFSQPRTYVYKGAATPETVALLGLAGAVGQQSIAGAATVPPVVGNGAISTSNSPVAGTPAAGTVPSTTTTTPPIAAAPPNPQTPTATANPPVAAAPPGPKPPSSTGTPPIVAAQPKTAQAPETTPSPMETASLPPPGGSDIPGLIGNNSILPDFWWLLPIGLLALLVWWGVRKLRSQQALERPPGDGSTPPIAGSDAAALPRGTAPEVSTLPSGDAIAPPDLWATPSTPPAATDTNRPNVGLAGGSIAGGLAASALGSREPDEPTTQIELPTRSDAPTVGFGEAATSSRREDEIFGDTGSLPPTEILAQRAETGMTPESLGLAGGAALAGGLAASQLSGAGEDETTTASTTEPNAIREIPTLSASVEATATAASRFPEVGDVSTATTEIDTSEMASPPTTTDTNAANPGLVGGLAASEIGGAGEDTIVSETTSPTGATEVASGILAPSSDVGETSTEQPIEMTETPSAEIPPSPIPTDGNSENWGLAAGTAFAGGLAASALGGAGDDEIPEGEEPSIEAADTETIAATSMSEIVDVASAENPLTIETETPTDATESGAEDLNLATGAALFGGAAGGAGLPGGAAALAGGAAAGAGLGAIDDIVKPSGADEFVPSASGGDEFVPAAADEFVPSSVDETEGETADVAPVPASSLPEFDWQFPDPADLAPAAAAAVGAAGGVPIDFEPSDDLAQSDVEAAKFDLGQSELGAEELTSVDEGLPDLPDGYGESRIVLVPCNPQWAYAYWDIPSTDKEAMRRQGGSQLALRFYDVTDIDIAIQVPHSLQQYACEEMARDWYLPIPAGDRDYIVEIGYVANDGRWLSLVRSQPIRVPPFYPSDWQNDRFATVPWNKELGSGKTLVDLGTPERNLNGNNTVYNSLFAMAQAAEAQRVAGSEFLSGIGVFPSSSGLISGMGMGSGMGMSGVGFPASMPPMRSRKFWLVADAELTVYGATEPDATVTIGGVPVPLSPDGTFRFQMAFRDGEIDYPIMAVAADGQQHRSIHMNFKRETRHRNTNTREEADDEVH